MQPAQGAILAAMRAAQNAISENERIFPIFGQRLASNDPREFTSTARKFAIWLSSEKAYYPAARAKIVELLEIALSTFKSTSIHNAAFAEIAEHLRCLVQAVVPFKHLFRENELQLKLHHIISETMLSISKTSASTLCDTALFEVPTSSNSSSLHALRVNPQPAMFSAPDSRLAVWRLQPTSSMSNVEKTGSVDPVHVNQFQSHDASEVAPSSQIGVTPSFSPPVKDTPQDCVENISQTTSKPLPKRIRRAELSEELVARDLDWFRSSQAAILNKGLDVPSSTVGESSPLLASPSPKRKTARIVPSRRWPRRILLDGTEFKSALPLASEPLVEKDGSCGNAEDTSNQMDAETRNVEQFLRSHTFLEPEPVYTPSKAPSIERQARYADYHCLLANGTSETTIHACSSAPFPEVTENGIESMDFAAEQSDSESLRSEHLSKLESTPPHSPRVPRNPILPPRVNALEPPLDLNFKIVQTPLGCLQQLATEIEYQRSDSMTTVLHSVQGKPFTHTHVVDVNLSETIFSKLSKWVKRRLNPSEASQGVCISLACYRLPEFYGRIKSQDGAFDAKTLTLQSPCSWPPLNRLSLGIKGPEERHTTVTLSPPFLLTSDQCIDISSLMKPGNNTLEIRQKDDLSGYLVVLHIHPPSQGQLAVLDVTKNADEQWKQFLNVLSGRVMPEKVLGNASVAVA